MPAPFKPSIQVLVSLVHDGGAEPPASPPSSIATGASNEPGLPVVAKDGILLGTSRARDVARVACAEYGARKAEPKREAEKEGRARRDE